MLDDPLHPLRGRLDGGENRQRDKAELTWSADEHKNDIDGPSLESGEGADVFVAFCYPLSEYVAHSVVCDGKQESRRTRIISVSGDRPQLLDFIVKRYQWLGHANLPGAGRQKLAEIVTRSRDRPNGFGRCRGRQCRTQADQPQITRPFSWSS
jgi:hypothetical protein